MKHKLYFRVGLVIEDDSDEEIETCIKDAQSVLHEKEKNGTGFISTESIKIIDLKKGEVLFNHESEHDKVENIQGTPVYRLRGNLLPLVYLNQELEIESVDYGENLTNIVVLQADDRQFGLVVDSIMDTEEIVVKPLGKQMKGIAAYAGSTIMGDGKVALILDVIGLAQKAHVVTESAKEKALEEVQHLAAIL